MQPGYQQGSGGGFQQIGGFTGVGPDSVSHIGPETERNPAAYFIQYEVSQVTGPLFGCLRQEDAESVSSKRKNLSFLVRFFPDDHLQFTDEPYPGIGAVDTVQPLRMGQLAQQGAGGRESLYTGGYLLARQLINYFL